MKFRFDGREKLLTFGGYPDVSLLEARARRDDARLQLRRHEDPSGARRRAREVAADAQRLLDEALTFEAAARAWHALRAPHWSTIHAGDVLASFERDVFPIIGAVPVQAIDPAAVLRVLRVIEARGAIETARRLRQRISAVFALGVSEGSATSDPAAIVTRALQPAKAKRAQPAAIELEQARAVIAASEAVPAAISTKLAARLLALTAVRPGVVRGAAWSEIEGVDWEGGYTDAVPLWRIPAARMKLVRSKKEDASCDHLVPLSRQAVDVLRAARAQRAPCTLIFAVSGGKALGENTIAALYHRAGLRGRHVPHGWRAAFSTILNERHRADRAVIDQALAHSPKDKVEAAYNRSVHMARRRELFQEWADMLLERATPAALITSGQQPD